MKELVIQCTVVNFLLEGPEFVIGDDGLSIGIKVIYSTVGSTWGARHGRRANVLRGAYSLGRADVLRGARGGGGRGNEDGIGNDHGIFLTVGVPTIIDNEENDKNHNHEDRNKKNYGSILYKNRHRG